LNNALTLNLSGDAPLRIELGGISTLVIGNVVDGALPVAANETVAVAGGTVWIDHARGLMWDVATTANEKTWPEAEAVAKNCRLGGFEDWRLPTLEELESIRDITRYNPAINTTIFADTKSSGYWTSSPDPSVPAVVFVVHFNHGLVNLNLRSGRFAVRAVRSVARASQ